MRTFLSAILCLGLARALPAQATLTIHEGAEAVTACFTYDSTVVSYIDTQLLGADSTEEILVHESVHQRQGRASIARSGQCPSAAPDSMLAREVEAYCVSDSLRLARIGPDTAKVSSETVERLYAQFYGALDLQADLSAWFHGCPRYARVPRPVGAP